MNITQNNELIYKKNINNIINCIIFKFQIIKNS